MRAVILSLLLLSGCTIAFATAGGISASSSNRAAREQHQPETASVGARVVLGALLGLVVDGLIIAKSMEDCCPDFGNNNGR